MVGQENVDEVPLVAVDPHQDFVSGFCVRHHCNVLVLVPACFCRHIMGCFGVHLISIIHSFFRLRHRYVCAQRNLL